MIRTIFSVGFCALALAACTTPKADTSASIDTARSTPQGSGSTTGGSTASGETRPSDGSMIRRPDVGGVGEAVSAVATNAGPKTGQPAPDFTWRTSDGATHSLKDYQGKAVLVNFWGTWCPPCRRELPDIVKLRNELGPQGFEVIGVCLENVPNPAEHVAKFAKANGLEYPLIIANGDVERAYGGIEAVPTSFFVNRQGVITDKLVGGGNEATFRSKIKKAM